MTEFYRCNYCSYMFPDVNFSDHTRECLKNDKKPDSGLIKLNNVSRVEVIDSTGRAYTKWKIKEVKYSFQDDGRTLKIYRTGTPRP